MTSTKKPHKQALEISTVLMANYRAPEPIASFAPERLT